MRTCWFAVGIAALLLTACVDASRVNTSCRWTDRSRGALDLSRAADREHLRQDVQLAWEIGQRYADVRFRNNPRRARPLLDSCRTAMNDSIGAVHGVTRAEIDRAAYARRWSVDMAAVYLPMLLVMTLAVILIRRELARSAWRGARSPFAWAGAVAVIALVATAVTQLWAMTVETWRLGNGHLAGRVFTLPSVVHPAAACGIAFAAAAAVALLSNFSHRSHAEETRRSSAA